MDRACIRAFLVTSTWLCAMGCRVSHETALKPDPLTLEPSEGQSGMAAPPATAAGGNAAEPAPPASGVGAAPQPPAAGMLAAGAAGVMAAAGQSAAGSGEPAAGMDAPPPLDAGMMPAPGASDPECDLSGIWIGKQLAVGVVLELPQSVNIWHYFEIAQQGDDFVVTNHTDCGVEVLGDVTVTITRATLEGTVMYNHQTGRKGTLKRSGVTCALDIARYWSVRGADEARYIPNPTRDSTEALADVARAKPLPTAAMQDGAIDPENDGHMGIAAQVSGIASGTRNSVQREWHRWFTEPGYEITPSTDWTSDLRIRAEYDMEESVIDPTSGLLTTVPAASTAYKHVMQLRFLGRTLSDPRAQAIVKSNPVETCYALQDALPAERLQ
jgi:hypothetical protein